MSNSKAAVMFGPRKGALFNIEACVKQGYVCTIGALFNSTLNYAVDKLNGSIIYMDWNKCLPMQMILHSQQEIWILRTKRVDKIWLMLNVNKTKYPEISQGEPTIATEGNITRENRSEEVADFKY